jgi:8-oxo-dGTP diphosphatase
VDIVLLIPEPCPKVLLIQRGHPPFAGHWAIPGGFVDPGETLEHAAQRELEEETHLTNVALQQFAAFGDPGRDPRGWTVSVVFWGYYTGEPELARAGDDAAYAQWWSLDELPPLAFDHSKILQQINKS